MASGSPSLRHSQRSGGSKLVPAASAGPGGRRGRWQRTDAAAIVPLMSVVAPMSVIVSPMSVIVSSMSVIVSSMSVIVSSMSVIVSPMSVMVSPTMARMSPLCRRRRQHERDRRGRAPSVVRGPDPRAPEHRGEGTGEPLRSHTADCGTRPTRTRRHGSSRRPPGP